MLFLLATSAGLVAWSDRHPPAVHDVIAGLVVGVWASLTAHDPAAVSVHSHGAGLKIVVVDRLGAVDAEGSKGEGGAMAGRSDAPDPVLTSVGPATAPRNGAKG